MPLKTEIGQGPTFRTETPTLSSSKFPKWVARTQIPESSSLLLRVPVSRKLESGSGARYGAWAS